MRPETGVRTIRMPDIGEGVAEVELVEWSVRVGDPVREDSVLAAVMTDKATVEVPSPVAGTVAWLGGEVGDRLAVGAPLIRISVAGAGVAAPEEEARDVSRETLGGRAEGGAPSAPDRSGGSSEPFDLRAEKGEPGATRAQAGASQASTQAPTKPSVSPLRRSAVTRAPDAGPRPSPAPERRAAGAPALARPLASPAIRRRATEAGIDLRRVPGSGPAGRITQEDLAAFLERGDAGPPSGGGRRADTSVSEVRITGLRRRIAERMAMARDRVVPITYVEEVDCEAVETLRAELNAGRREDRPKLTLMPFLVRALVLAVRDSPAMNSHFDDEAGVLRRFGGVHVGIAAQTPAGLVVPVLRHAEARSLWDAASEIARLADAARSGGATREELTGSTVTISSLGALGGIASTPVVNVPEVAILGVNRMEVRPVWDGARFVPRRRMNLSASFDHRVVDGFDAAVFVRRIKALVEAPAMLFIEE